MLVMIQKLHSLYDYQTCLVDKSVMMMVLYELRKLWFQTPLIYGYLIDVILIICDLALSLALAGTCYLCICVTLLNNNTLDSLCICWLEVILHCYMIYGFDNRGPFTPEYMVQIVLKTQFMEPRIPTCT